MSQLDTWQKRHVELSRLRIFFVQIAQDYDQGVENEACDQPVISPGACDQPCDQPVISL